MRKVAFVVICIAFFSIARLAKAALVIEPALIELKLDQNRNSGTFTLRNVGDKEERYRAKSVYFTITKTGALKEIPSDEYSLAEWIKFNPKEFVLPPKSSRMVRFSVVPRGKIQERAYRGAIQFMPLQAAHVGVKDAQGRSINLYVVSVVLVPIYGYGEGIQNSGKITEVFAATQKVKSKKEKTRVEKQYLYCNVSNTGEGILQMRGQCRILDAGGKKLVEEIPMPLFVIYPKGERLVQIGYSESLPSGRYKVNFKLSSADPKYKLDLSKEAEIKVTR